MELVVGQLWKSTTGSHTGAVEFVVGIVHLVTAEHGLQTTFVESFVMGDEGQALNQRFHLFPYFWEDWGFLSILTTETMNLAAPIVIVVGFWLYQRIELVHNLAVTHDYHTNGADAGSLVVGRLEIDCCKVPH